MKTTCIACFTMIVGLLSLLVGNSEAQIGNPALSGQLEPGQPDISEYPLQLRGQQSTQGASGAIADAWLKVNPFEPMPQDVVVLTVLGYWLDTGFRVIAHDHTLGGNLVTLNIYAVSDPVQISFSVSELIGQLPAGLYDVEVLLQGVETILITTFTVFPYTPPSLIWDEDERLTDNDLSDSAPKSTWHDGEIHLLWTHSYDCVVRHGVFDSTGLHDLENIASCPTGSGPGVASFEDTLLGFYAQGEYPGYNLFGKAIDPAAAQFQLTFGDDLYDRYGAAALTYEDALHLFWKRWVETGYRHVFHRTYDGQSWSDGVFVTEDYYFDTRPTAAVYNGEIYLFYLGGSQFRTFDGASWSDATLLFNGGDGNVTPAACTLNGFLFLLFRYDGQMYYKRFDGSEWTAARTVPSAPADEPRDLECIASEDELYLFWGSRYSWPRSELFAKRAVPEPNQMLFMATAIVVLAQLKRRRRTRS